MNDYTNGDRLPTIWRPFDDEPFTPPIPLSHGSNWEYREPAIFNNFHFTPTVPHLIAMQQPPPANHSFAVHEPPMKRRCISLEVFMKDRATQRVPKIQQMPNSETFVQQATKTLMQQTIGASEYRNEFKRDFTRKVFGNQVSDSSGISSLPSIPVTSETSRETSSASARGSVPLATNAYNTNLDFENELLRIAIQYGPQFRLQKFIFQVDDSLMDDFALDNYDSPNPVVRISRSKFNWIFQDQPQMSRKFKKDEPKSNGEVSEPDKKPSLFTARQKSRINMAISDIEEFVTKEMTREKMLLISRYRAFNNVLRAALSNVDKESV